MTRAPFNVNWSFQTRSLQTRAHRHDPWANVKYYLLLLCFVLVNVVAYFVAYILLMYPCPQQFFYPDYKCETVQDLVDLLDRLRAYKMFY